MGDPVAERVVKMSRVGASMMRHPWIPVEELTDSDRVAIMLAAGVGIKSVEMTPNGPRITMNPAAIAIHDGSYVVFAR